MKKANLLKGLIGIGALALAMPAITLQTSCGETPPVADRGIPTSLLTVNNDGELMLVDTKTDLSPYDTLRVPAAIDGKNVLLIGKEAFINWTSLTKINFADAPKCTAIREGAFAGKYDAAISVNFNAVTSIGTSAFTGVKFNNLNLENVTTVDSKAFFDCEIKSIEIGKLSNWKYDSFYFKNDFQITTSGSELYKVFETTEGKTVVGQTIYPVKQSGINESLAGLGWGKLNLDQATSWDVSATIYKNYFSNSRITYINSNSINELQSEAISSMPLLTGIQFPKLQLIQIGAIVVNPKLTFANIGYPKNLDSTIIHDCPILTNIQTTYLENPTTLGVKASVTSFSLLPPVGTFENIYTPESQTSSPEVVEYFQKSGGLGSGWTAKPSQVI